MTASVAAPPVSAAEQRRGLLALALQEAFTVTLRLRENRQVAADAFSFRAHVKQLLSAADQEARRMGYAPETVRQAIYGFVAFLDETVLNSAQAMFAEWPRRPLQEELFGDHVAGETFFRHLQQLLATDDSEELADLLEVHQLCLLLGFHGRYAVGEKGELAAIRRAVEEKIRRIRGEGPPFSPEWPLPAGEVVPPARDPWVRRLQWTLAGIAVATLLLFLLFRTLLGGGLEPLRALGT